jgi:hypothetical protein
MRCPSLFWGLAAAGLLALSGCALAPAQPRSWNTLALTPVRRTVAVKLRIGDGLRVVLPVPQGGGDFEWEIVSNSEDVLKQLTPLYPTAGAPGPGPSGERTVSFAAVDEGRSVLRFAALQPSASLSQATDFYEIDVTARP